MTLCFLLCMYVMHIEMTLAVVNRRAAGRDSRHGDNSFNFYLELKSQFTQVFFFFFLRNKLTICVDFFKTDIYFTYL